MYFNFLSTNSWLQKCLQQPSWVMPLNAKEMVDTSLLQEAEKKKEKCL